METQTVGGRGFGEETRITFNIHPIGVIRTPFKTREACPHQGRPSGIDGEVILREDLLPALKDLEGCTFLILLSYLDQADRVRLQTKTPFGPEIRGVFATRSSNRPNPIGLHVVELLKMEGNHLHVRGVDCIDGTPLIDIKPYVAHLDSVSEAKVAWHEKTKACGPKGGER
jgi:tRNA-Thr(GGU) m(6)t(6)A37 methyltransferase TsaA